MIKRTIKVIVPVKIEVDSEADLSRIMKAATEELHIDVCGIGLHGGYSYKSQEKGRSYHYNP